MTSGSSQKILKQLESVFRDHFFDDSIILTQESSPEDIEAWDSLAHVNLLLVVEATFGVRFTAEEMGDINDVAALLAVLARKGVTTS